MNLDLLAPIVAAVVFASGVAGLAFSNWHPSVEHEGHTRDLLNRLTGLVATLSAVALGLLVAQSNSVYRTQEDGLERVCARVMQLDVLLGRFGPEAGPTRVALRDFVRTSYESAPDGAGTTLTVPAVGRAAGRMDGVFAALEALRATAPAAKLDQLTKAQDLAEEINYLRLEMSLQLADTLSWPLIWTVIGWLVVLFFGFGMLAPFNRVGIVALATGAVTVASALFLIVELSSPYDSLIRVSPKAVIQTVRVLDAPPG